VAIGSASIFSSLSFTTYDSETSFENITIFNPTYTSDDPIASSPSAAIETDTDTDTDTESFLSSASSSSTIPTLSVSMGFEGKTIPECCCSFCEIEEANQEIVYPLLKKVVETPFFSHFKIDLCSTCELWDDDPLCRMKDCGVCECEEPPEWSFANVPEMPPTGPDPHSECEGVADDNVVTTVDSDVVDGWGISSLAASGNNMQGGNMDLSFLMDDGDDNTGASSGSSSAQVVDLLKNPEGYTGYTGPSAEKVWSAIHSQNCFQKPNDEEQGQSESDEEKEGDLYCSLSPEQRLYNRFISGLHSSISLHIAHSYCLEMDPYEVGECRMWGPNDAIAYDRVLNHPDRVENLYVAFSLLLRAVVKAEFAIAAAVPDSDPVLKESLSYWQESLLPELMALPEKAPVTFDESALLNLEGGVEGSSSELLKSKRTELQRRFRELQSIMQCVGCDRCKLWGTLQTLGVGTALRILFHDPHKSIHLTRQESVALVNTLERLSSSLVFAREFRTRKEETDLFGEEGDASCGK